MKKPLMNSERWNTGFYSLSKMFLIEEIIKLIGIAILVSIIFFNSIRSSVFLIPGMVILFKLDVRKYKADKMRKFVNEFKNLVVCMSGNIEAGHAMESAFLMAVNELCEQEPRCQLSRYRVKFANELACNVTLEEIFVGLANQCKIEDVSQMANIIVSSKRYGGDVMYLVRQYARNIAEQDTTSKEIETMLAAKKLEGKIMVFAPLAVIAYMRLTSEGYMNSLYTTVLGKIIMVICLLVLLAVVVLTDKIVRIEV